MSVTVVPLPSLEAVRAAFAYDRATGVFRWRRRMDRDNAWNAKHAEKIAGTAHNEGYRSIRFNGRSFLAHGLAWFYEHGEWPSHDIDHRDTERSCDSLENLRPATRSQNNQNARLRRNHPTGLKGAMLTKSGKRFWSRIVVAKSRIYLGVFDTAEQAHSAYVEAAQRYFGEFARSGDDP